MQVDQLFLDAGFAFFTKADQGMTNGVCAFLTNKNPTLFLAQEQQIFYASTCTNAEFSYFMFVMYHRKAHIHNNYTKYVRGKTSFFL